MSAAWYKEQPKNRNYLAPVGFKLSLELFEGVDFFCQSANFPNITMPFTEVPTRFRSFPIVPGGGVEYGDFNVTFIIDEDLVNYLSIKNWIEKNADANETNFGEVDYSNGQLLIATSNFNVSHIIEFERLFPVSLTEIEFDSTVTDIEYFTATVVFKYSIFNVRDKNFKKL